MAECELSVLTRQCLERRIPQRQTVAAEAAASGRSVHPWTVDDPEEMRRLAALGVGSITTNDCEAARRVPGT